MISTLHPLRIRSLSLALRNESYRTACCFLPESSRCEIQRIRALVFYWTNCSHISRILVQNELLHGLWSIKRGLFRTVFVCRRQDEWARRSAGERMYSSAWSLYCYKTEDRLTAEVTNQPIRAVHNQERGRLSQSGSTLSYPFTSHICVVRNWGAQIGGIYARTSTNVPFDEGFGYEGQWKGKPYQRILGSALQGGSEVDSKECQPHWVPHIKTRNSEAKCQENAPFRN